MKVKELYKQVAQLGFETSLESAERFYFATNRSIAQVNLLRPKIKVVAINHAPLSNLITDNTLAPTMHTTDDLVYQCEGNAIAYYFEAQGCGICYVQGKDTNGKWSKIADHVNIPYSKKFEAFKGIISASEGNTAVRLVFSGEFAYTVKNVALYGTLLSDNKTDIPPYLPYTRYNVKEYADDFLSLASPPVVEDNEYYRLNSGYELEGNDTILFPHNTPGCYLIRYSALPKALTVTLDPTKDETVIDLDEELCTLLPLIVAVYNLASDEPELANAYKQMYLERSSEILATKKDYAPVKFHDSNGWG